MPTMAQESFLKRRCHHKLNFTSSTPYVLDTYRTEMLFSSPRVAPKWPHICPRCPQDVPKTGRDSPNMATGKPTMVQESFLKRRCHNNLNFTSSTSCCLHTSRTKTPFSSPRVAPRWPNVWPRCPQDAPKTGQHSPWMAINMPTMAQEGLLKRRCQNNPNFTSSTSYLLHNSQPKTLFSSPRVPPRLPHVWPRCPQDAPKTGQDNPKMAVSMPTMAQEGLLQRGCHNNLNLTSPTS